MNILAPHIGLIFWQTIVLLVAYVALRQVAWKPLLAFMKKEEEAYASALEEAQKARKTTQQLQVASQEIINKARAKEQRILEKARVAQEAMQVEGQEAVEQLRAQMLQQTEREIAQQKKAAMVAFKQQASTLVVHAAEKVLQFELQQKAVQAKVIAKLLEGATEEKQQAHQRPS